MKARINKAENYARFLKNISVEEKTELLTARFGAVLNKETIKKIASTF